MNTANAADNRRDHDTQTLQRQSPINVSISPAMIVIP